ncbi:MAG: glycosyltransferase family 39 protein [Casimicrobiaceae bacterium]
MPSDSASYLPHRAILFVLAALVGALWFANVEHRVLQHPDEGRYAEIAREMAATGDWLTPRLNGLKYFEKPPLQYWLTAATFDAFGVHAWSARLWPVLAGLIAVGAIGVAGLLLGGAALGVTAALVLAGTLWQVALSQIITLDALLSGLLAVGFAAFVIAQRAEATPVARRHWMWLAWAAMAGASLTKGLIGVVIPAGALVLYSLAARDFGLWRRLSISSGMLVYLAVAAPWFVAVSLANPEFASFFFVHEHFQRFLTTEHRRTGSLWYFVPLFIAGVIPWIAVLLWSLPRAWREGTPNGLGFSWQRFALVWAGFVLVFFSVSGSKLPSYILPMFPPLALVLGWVLLRLDARTLARLTLPMAAAAIVLALAAWFAYPRLAAPFADDRQPVDALLAFGTWVKLALTAAAVGGIIALAAFHRSSARARFTGIAALAVATLATTQLVVGGLDSFRLTRSAYDILQQAEARVTAGPALDSPAVPFFQVRMYDQTIPFYLRRTTTVVEFADELALGVKAEPDRAIATVDNWITVWSALADGYAVVPPADLAALAARGVPMRVLAEDTRRAIVSRR